jgi:hypothetical protein
MEKSQLQVEWDKIKESNLIRVKTIQKKYLDQIRTLHSDDYRHNAHVVIGWYSQESFDYVLLKEIHSGGMFKMPIWAYCQGHMTSSKHDYRNMTNEEVVAMEKSVRETFDQIFI